MMPMRHPSDGRLHFSELKQHAKSPAHVKLACERARDVTRAMTVGSVADALVFGHRKVAVYPGKVRAGKEWALFQSEYAGHVICNLNEYEDAKGAADAVIRDPVAQGVLAGCDVQVVAQWERDGIECAAGIAGERGGFDAIRGPRTKRIQSAHECPIAPGYIADLKVTSSTDPRDLQRHAWRQFWPAQGAWYLDGAQRAGYDVQDFYIVAVEASPPHCVTIMRIAGDAVRTDCGDGYLHEVPPEALALAKKQIAMWLERHRACEASGVWPGYVQSVVELELESWMGGEEE